MDVAGLLLDTTPTCFFARENATARWNTLSWSTLLQGPPGSGMSTFVWFWLLRFVVQTQEPVVWYHFDRDGDVCVLVKQCKASAVELTEIQDDNPST